MRYVNYVRFVEDPDAVSAIRPAHRLYLGRLIDRGSLLASGPFADGSGALFVYEAESLEQAEQLAAEDPYAAGGVVEQNTVAPWNMVYCGLGFIDPPPDTRPSG